MKKIITNYWLLLSIQSTGAVIIIAAALPLYRILLFHMNEFKNDGFYAMWGIVGIAIILIPHWFIQNIPLPIVKKSKAVNHFIAFAARLIFLIPGALFSFIFLRRLDDLNLQAWKILVLLFVQFSVYCYTRNLYDLAYVFNKPRPKNDSKANNDEQSISSNRRKNEI